MPLKHQGMQKLKDMQTICTAVEDDAKSMRKALSMLKAAGKREGELVSLYENDWLRLATSKSMTAAQREELEGMAPAGRYSILGEDTIWDALAEIRLLRAELLKVLAKRL